MALCRYDFLLSRAPSSAQKLCSSQSQARGPCSCPQVATESRLLPHTPGHTVPGQAGCHAQGGSLLCVASGQHEQCSGHQGASRMKTGQFPLLAVTTFGTDELSLEEPRGLNGRALVAARLAQALPAERSEQLRAVCVTRPVPLGVTQQLRCPLCSRLA